jgi:integrase/recombinase XerD
MTAGPVISPLVEVPTVSSLRRDVSLSRPKTRSLTDDVRDGDVTPSHPDRPAWASNIPKPADRLPRRVEDWLEWIRVVRNRPATTLRVYRADVAKFVAFLASTVDLRSPDLFEGLDRTSLRRYQLELAGVLPNPRSRNRALVTLRNFLGFAYDEGWTDKDLSRQVVLPRFVMGDPHPIATADVPRLLAALPTKTLLDLRDRALVFFLLSSGCRIAEALSLDRTDVHLEGFRVLGKGGKHRSVYVTEKALAAVRDYLRARGPDDSSALWISVAYADRPGGITRPDNRLTPDGARYALNELRRRLSADPELFRLFSALRSPHVARHTAATTLLEATNGDVRLVQEVLGHATLETLRVYTEITDTRKQAAYQRLSEYLGEVAARV